MDHNESPPSIRINPTLALNGPEEHLLDEIRQVIRKYLVFGCMDVKQSFNFHYFCNFVLFYNFIFRRLMNIKFMTAFVDISMLPTLN